MSFKIPLYVLFDLDGTLLDSLPGITESVKVACRAVGVPEPETDLRMLLGPPIRGILAKALCTEDVGLLDRLETAFRSHYDAEGWQKTRCFADAREALEALRDSGHRLFVVSNKPLQISRKILEREALLPFFEKIYTRDSREPSYTSKTEMVREFLRDYGAPCSDCLLVGDTVDDVTASTGNGVAVAIMDHGYGEVSPDGPAHYRMRSFLEFLYREEMGEGR